MTDRDLRFIRDSVSVFLLYETSLKTSNRCSKRHMRSGSGSRRKTIALPWIFPKVVTNWPSLVISARRRSVKVRQLFDNVGSSSNLWQLRNQMLILFIFFIEFYILCITGGVTSTGTCRSFSTALFLPDFCFYDRINTHMC